MKNYLFFSKDGFTFDNDNEATNNMQILGNGMGNNVFEALLNFKDNHKYLLTQSYSNIFAVQTVGDVIMNLEL